MGMSEPPNGNYDPVSDRVINTDDEIINIFDLTDEDFTPEESYRLALESIFRWTLRRDELNDSQIVLAIKRVAKYALQDF